MSFGRLAFVPLALTLGACSYAYDVQAVVINGRLAFVADPHSQSNASCFNEVDVVADRAARTNAYVGDDLSRVSYGTYWHQRLAYDCVDKFPIFYGQSFKGKALSDDSGTDVVTAKPLRMGVVYEISTVSGATGYGSGAFKILPDHRVINVPPPSMLDMEDPPNKVGGSGR